MTIYDYMSGFCDELEKLPIAKTAMIGALLGATTGYIASGKSPRSKLISTIAGAGIGHLTGKALGVAKRGVWDEPKERAHRDLYEYRPSTLSMESDNF